MPEEKKKFLKNTGKNTFKKILLLYMQTLNVY